MNRSLQPPRAADIDWIMRRAERSLGPEAADLLASWLVDDWEAAAGAPDRAQGLYAAGQLLLRSRALRRTDHVLATQLCRLAESCAQAWLDEITATVAGLDLDNHEEIT